MPFFYSGFLHWLSSFSISTSILISFPFRHPLFCRVLIGFVLFYYVFFFPPVSSLSAHSHSLCPSSLLPFISSRSSKISSFHSPTLDAFSWCLSPSGASWAPFSASPPPSLFTFHTIHGLHKFSHRFPVPPSSQVPSSSCLAVEQGSVAPSLQILLSQEGAGGNLTAAARKPHCGGAEIWAHSHISAQLKVRLGH